MTYYNRIKKLLNSKERTAGDIARQVGCATNTARQNLDKLVINNSAEILIRGKYCYYKEKKR